MIKKRRNDVMIKEYSFSDATSLANFIEEKKNLKLRFKGSENQRIIDVKKSMEENRIVLWEGDVNAV
jgi:anaerobic ribonucleoside-triphosphate reductase activating protein